MALLLQRASMRGHQDGQRPDMSLWVFLCVHTCILHLTSKGLSVIIYRPIQNDRHVLRANRPSALSYQRFSIRRTQTTECRVDVQSAVCTSQDCRIEQLFLDRHEFCFSESTTFCSAKEFFPFLVYSFRWRFICGLNKENVLLIRRTFTCKKCILLWLMLLLRKNWCNMIEIDEITEVL